MKSPNRLGLVVATLVIAGAGGAIVGRWVVERDAPPPVHHHPEPLATYAPARRSANGASLVSSPQALQPWGSAWAEALLEPDPSRRHRALARLAPQAGLLDLLEALDLAEGIDEPSLRSEVHRLLLVRWLHFDAAMAASYAQSLFVSEAATEPLGAVLRRWSGTDLAAALRWYAQVPPPHLPAQITSALGDTLAALPPARVLELLQGVPAGRARIALCGRLVENWKDGRPAEAADLVTRLLPPEAQVNLLGDILPRWARSEWRNALQWVQELPPGAGRLGGLLHLSHTWVQTNPTEAAEFARHLPPGNEQFLTTVASQWVRLDAPAASAWALDLPEGPAKERTVASMTAAWAQHDPKAAADFAAHVPAGAAQDEAAISAVSAWATTDAATAFDWVEQFPRGQLREYAMENLFFHWAHTDAGAAVERSGQLTSRQDRDIAIYAMAGRLLEIHPDLAAESASVIRSEALRARQSERAARAWLEIEPAAARDWIERSGLPVPAKQRLLRPPAM